MSDERIEAVAREAWDYAEKREQRIQREQYNREVSVTPWECAHELDREEYREYVRFIAAALDRLRDARSEDDLAAARFRIRELEAIVRLSRCEVCGDPLVARSEDRPAGEGGSRMSSWSDLSDIDHEATARDALIDEVQEWVERCRNLTDPNPGGWTEALHEARAALAARSPQGEDHDPTENG